MIIMTITKKIMIIIKKYNIRMKMNISFPINFLYLTFPFKKADCFKAEKWVVHT